jgi:glycerol-3-phosphate dehydrogenase
MPGGDFPFDGQPKLVAGLLEAYPFLEEKRARRLVRTYGTEAAEILGNARSADDLGRHFGAGLTEAEIRWLMAREYARTAEDVIWRRTKLGLRLEPAQVAEIDAFMAGVRAARPAAE